MTTPPPSHVLPWLFLPRLSEVGEITELDDREARHAIGSKRLRSGDRLVLFDGAGEVATAELAESAPAAGRAVQVRIFERQRVSPPVPLLHLAAALPKGDRQSTMLGMATQLTMASFTPLTCRHSVVRGTPSFPQRAHRICLEACKQSHRAHCPDVHPPTSPAELAARAREDKMLLLLADPSGVALTEALPPGGPGAECVILIGPEGGFVDEEVDAVRDAGGQIVRLGPTILRIETAAVALLSALLLVASGRPS